MASKPYSEATDKWKCAATVAAIPLIGTDTALNAEHIASVEGWASTLVVGAIAATVSAAAALPIAERAWLSGERGKAAIIGAFFGLMVAYSFTTSVGRVGGKADDDLAAATRHNSQIALARHRYDDARGVASTECATGNGTRCKDANARADAARAALASQPAARTGDSMARRISQATGFSVESVQLYQPLILPLALQFGGFGFLAFGLAPRRAPKFIDIEADPKPEAEPVEIKAAEPEPMVRAIEKPTAQPMQLAFQAEMPTAKAAPKRRTKKPVMH